MDNFLAALQGTQLSARVPGLELRGLSDIGDPAEVEVILSDVSMSAYGGFSPYPHLRWVQYLGHGAGDMILDPTLPADVPVTRQKRESIARGLAIYVVQAVTTHHLRVAPYRQQQREHSWNRIDSPAPSALTVVVLGLGVIGYTIACRLRDLGYAVVGWSRAGRGIEGVASAAGSRALRSWLPECDYVVGALPETRETVGLIDKNLLALMKPGVYLVNVGRGSLIVEPDLLDALDSGQVAGAALDVFATEPLPQEHRFWSHPKITLTPHAGGPGQDDEGMVFDEIAENYRRFKAGRPLNNVVDRELGY